MSRILPRHVRSDHFLEKKDIMLPWPAFTPFLPADGLLVDGAWTLGFLGAGSSSEKDSQAASSLVTAEMLAKL